jgi:hypothetical protein
MAKSFVLTAALIGGLGAISGGTAWAQPVTMSPRAVTACLCSQDAVAQLQGQVQEARRVYAERRQAAQALSRQVEEARGRVNVDNAADIESFRNLLARRDEAERAYQEQGPAVGDIVARYNAAVAGVNGNCTGKLFDPEELRAVRQTLSCPRPY